MVVEVKHKQGDGWKPLSGYYAGKLDTAIPGAAEAVTYACEHEAKLEMRICEEYGNTMVLVYPDKHQIVVIGNEDTDDEFVELDLMYRVIGLDD